MTEAATFLKDEKFYSKLDLFLGDINKIAVRMNEEDKKFCVGTTKNVVNKLIEKLKNEDPVFKSLFNRITHVGSYYDGLRVSEATEFDLNLILKLPCIYEKIEVESSDSPGFVRLNVRNAVDEKKLNALPSLLKIWKRWVNDNGYLLHDKVLNWFEGVLSKISENGKHPIQIEGKIYEVTVRKNGPAHTLHIQEGKFQIDVDLVPVIEFTTKPPKPVRWFPTMPDPWVVVPKALSCDKTNWRLSFPVQEQKLMNGQLHLKYINRLVKKFRDANRLKVSSYYIKTFFLWEAFDKGQSNNQDFWRKRPSFLFVYMLVKLADALEKRTLKFFWDEEMNLFDTLDTSNLCNMMGQVTRILGKIHRLLEGDNAELKKYIYQIFGVTEEILCSALEDMNLNDETVNNPSSERSTCIII